MFVSLPMIKLEIVFTVEVKDFLRMEVGLTCIWIIFVSVVKKTSTGHVDGRSLMGRE
jgi:hypothetical protein